MSVLSRRIWGIVALAVAAIVLATALTVHARDVRDRIMRTDPQAILGRPELADRAIAIGRAGFATHCVQCHGTGTADPARGIPDLTDEDFLYGSGQVDEIEQIVLHGIRSGDPRGWNLASMPAYATAKPYAAEPIPPLRPSEIRDIVEFMMRRHGKPATTAAADRGGTLFSTSGACWDCHASDGGGDDAIGGPNLLDDIWLYGDGSRAALTRSIAQGRAGVSPAFARRLSASDARAIAVYVASLSHPRPKDPARD